MKEITITHQISPGFEYYLDAKFDNNEITLNNSVILRKEQLNKLLYEYRQYEKTLQLNDIQYEII